MHRLQIRLARMFDRSWRKSLKSLCSILIITQWVLGPIALAADKQPNSPTSASAQTAPEVRKILDVADSLDNSKPIPPADPMHFYGQYVEVFEGQPNPISTYTFANHSLQPDKLAYTLLRARFDKAKNALVIEAFRGANDKGENGQLVARQYIPNLNIVALAQDSEILSMVDTSGKIHAVDWGYVASQAFRSAVPVFSNLIEPLAPVDLSADIVTAKYLTIAVQPFDSNNTLPDAVIPRSATGEIQLKAGDLLVTTTPSEGTTTKVFGVFSRDRMHEAISHGNALLAIEAELMTADPQYIDRAATTLKAEEAKSATFEADLKALSEASANPMIAMALRSFAPDQLTALRSRVLDHQRYSGRDRDWFTMTEWTENFAKLKANADKANPDLSTADFEREWQSFLSERPVAKEPSNARYYAAYGAAVAAVTLYMASPELMERMPELKQVGLLNWIYEYGYPAQLKDAAYRWPLIKSSLSLVAMWPLAIGVSFLSGKALSVLSKVAQGSTSVIARKVRDLAKDWTDLDIWQRITSFGMRRYCDVFLGFWITAIERIGRQKSFFTALNNNLNPLSRVMPDSELGRAVGLEAPIRLGLNNPFASNATLTAQVRVRNQLMGEIKAKRERLRSHAFLLAAIGVADAYNIDLGSTLLAESENLSSKDLQNLLEDPKARADWELLTHDLSTELARLPFDVSKGELSEIPTEEFAKHVEMAKAAATKLVKLDPTRKYLKKLKVRAAQIGMGVKHGILNLGRENFNFLKAIYTNKFVSGQVEREFVSDHLLTVGVVPFSPERSDLSKPEQLAADPHGMLWTSPQHWTDMFMNLYVHFFAQGARTALIYQEVKAKEETIYAPREDIELQSPSRQQGLLPGILQWTKDVINPAKADLGSIILKTWKRSVTTIQAYIIMNVATRMMLGEQTFHDAAFGSALVWLSQAWYFGWVWWPIQSGNKLYGEHFEDIAAQVTTARRYISWGLRESDPATAEKHLTQGLDELKKIYAKYAPEILAKVDTTLSVTDQARQLLELSTTDPSLRTDPNGWIMWSTPMIGAISSTLLAIPMAVMTFDANALTWTNLAEWAGISAALTGGVYALLGAKPWGTYRKKLKELFGKNQSCSEALGS